MHILLLILKIIGIVILVLLGLVLAMILTVLFVPVRYSACAMKKAQDYGVKAKITWLLHLISIEAAYGKEGPGGCLKVGFFTLKRFGSYIEETKTEDIKSENTNSEDPAAGTAPEKTVTASDVKAPAEENVSGMNASSAEENDAETESLAEDAEEEAENTQEKPKQTIGERINGFFSKINAAVSRVIRLISELPQKFFDALWAVGEALEGRTEKLEKGVDGALNKASEGYQKISAYLNDQNKNVLQLLLRRLKILIRHYRIRTIKGELTFGTGKPDLTAKIGGLLYMILPAGAGKFEVTPVMNEFAFETDVSFAGHIRAVHVVWMLIRLLLSKDVRSLIKQVLRSRRK